MSIINQNPSIDDHPWYVHMAVQVRKPLESLFVFHPIVPTLSLLELPSSGGGFRSVNGGGIGSGAIPFLTPMATI